MSSSAPPSEDAAADGPSPTLPRGRGRLRRLVAGFVVLVGCLVLPWFIPWGSSETRALSRPDVVAVTAEPRPGQGAAKDAAPGADPVRRLRDTTQSSKTLPAGYDNPVTTGQLAGVSTRPGPYRRLGRIEIPAIGLNVDYGEGVFAKTLTRGPGHWPGTPVPGAVGNSVLSGHRNTETQPFKELDELHPGDAIITHFGDRGPVTFKVVKTTIVPEAEYADFVLQQPKSADARELTLFACHPEGNPVFRIVVQARA